MGGASVETVSGVTGIDVSSNQGSVNWSLVAGQNLAFAYIRATVGAHTADARFAGNWTRIYGTGLLRGAYHFFWPLAAASDQADHFVEIVGRLLPGDLPPVLDLEEAYLNAAPQQDVWTTVSPDNRLPMILNWLTAVEHSFGIRPIIYSRQNFLENLLGDKVAELSSYLLWIAEYTAAPTPRTPTAWSSWTLWQYSDQGNVAGITGNVDQDRFNGTLTDLKNLAMT
jgi:lysozyme